MGMCIQAFPVQPDSLNFIVPSSGETGYWPGESIAVKAWWSAAAESLYCRIQNHDNDDSLTVLLIPDTEDTNIASISLEFQTGWELAAESINDELLQCSYGNRISVNSAGMADSCRILVEEASIQLDPSDTIFVGTDIALTWIDRDANVDYGQIDSVSLTLRSVSTGHSAIALLRETSVQSGIFRGHVPVSCDLAVEEDSVAIRVLDADSIVVEGFDSLFASGTWDEGIESSPVDTVIAISTRTAVIEARHSVYGDLNLFPIAGDSMIITIHEHDLEGVDSIAIDVGVYSPD